MIVIDNEQLIKGVKPYMVLSGTWKLNSNPRSLSNRIYSYGFQGIFMLFLCLLCLKLIQLVAIKADLQAIISNVAILVSSFAVWMKIFLYQRNKVPEMYREIIDEETKVWLSLDDDIILPYKKKIKFCRKLILGIITNVLFAMGSLFLVSLASFILSDKTVTKSDKETLQESFMYPIWLPYKEKENAASVICLNLLFAFVGIVLYSVSHMIFAVLMVFATAQMELLQVKIRKLISERGEFNELREIIIKHAYLTKFIEDLNHSTKYVVLVDFLLNSLNVASVAIQVISLQTPSQIIFPLAYLVVLVTQVFGLGWLANEIHIQSLSISDALTQTEWYDQDEKFKNSFKIMLMRSQKPLRISIGPFGAMTLETALATMRAAYSYITLMRNFK